MHTVNATYLQTIARAMIGLIGAPAAYPVYFQTRWGIHTFGMKFPIDVIVLDSAYRVVQTCTALSPNRVFVWNPKYYHVIELPANTVSRRDIRTGEKILIRNVQEN